MQSHSLWYTSSRSPVPPRDLLESIHGEANNGQNGGQSRHRGQKFLESTALARLAADEQYAIRRRLNIQNFGSGWLRPPGVPKTLYQMREERREQEEHQEAMRREQAQQELADAEAAAMPDDGTMDDVQLDGAQDLDDMIPEADDDFGVGDDDDEEEEEDDDDDEDEADDDDLDATAEVDEDQLREERQNDLITARLGSNNDAFREALARGDPDGDDMYGGAEELEEEDQGHMLDEEDFAGQDLAAVDGGNLDEDMGVDLDEDIPEAESGGYEHTDSEAEMSSEESGSGSGDEDEDDEGPQEIGFAPRAAMLEPPLSPTARMPTTSSGPRASMDISGLLSQDESSFMDSSPAQARWQQRQG